MRLPKPRKVVKHGNERYVVYVPRSFGGGRLYFETEEEANKKVSGFLTFAGRATADFHTHSQDVQLGLLRLLDEFGSVQALRDAAVAGKGRVVKGGARIVDAVRDCIEAKRAANVRPYYLYQFKYSLDGFTAGIGVDTLDDVTHDILSAWLNGSGWSPRTRKNKLTDVQTLYNFAIKRGLAHASPTKAMDRPILERKPPGILTVAQVRSLLKRCLKMDRKLAPFLAVQLFGGIRPTEAQRITRKDITNGHIRIESAASKTRERRLVTINPTLRAWLKIKGELPPLNWRKRLRLVRGQMKWPHDCLRHSFCSYALPIWGAAKVALEAGHSEQVLFTHYREIVTPSTAKAFFSIRP